MEFIGIQAPRLSHQLSGYFAIQQLRDEANKAGE